MAAGKKPARKKARKSAAPKGKAGVKKKVVKKTAKKAVKKAPSGVAKKAVKKTVKKATRRKAAKATDTKKPSRAKKAAAPKLGLDPLDHLDIDSLDAPSGVVHGADKGLASGIDALIRDTSANGEPASHESPRTLAPTVEPQAGPDDISTDDEGVMQHGPADREEDAMPDAPGGIEPESDKPESVEIVLPPAPPADPVPAAEQPAAGEPEAEMAQTGAQPDVNAAAAPTATVQKKAPAPKVVDEERADISVYFSFMLGREQFALAIENVKEVLEHSRPTRVPKTPPHMKGVLNLRGSVVPVVDLRMFLGLPETEVDVHTAIVIVETVVEGEESKIGAIVDSVSEVLEIKDSDVEPAPKIGTGINTDYIKGMGKVRNKLGEDEFVMILGVDEVFKVNTLLDR